MKSELEQKCADKLRAHGLEWPEELFQVLGHIRTVLNCSENRTCGNATAIARVFLDKASSADLLRKLRDTIESCLYNVVTDIQLFAITRDFRPILYAYAAYAKETFKLWSDEKSLDSVADRDTWDSIPEQVGAALLDDSVLQDTICRMLECIERWKVWRVTYPAKFTKLERGWAVKFPDLGLSIWCKDEECTGPDAERALNAWLDDLREPAPAPSEFTGPEYRPVTVQRKWTPIAPPATHAPAEAGTAPPPAPECAYPPPVAGPPSSAPPAGTQPRTEDHAPRCS